MRPSRPEELMWGLRSLFTTCFWNCGTGAVSYTHLILLVPMVIESIYGKLRDSGGILPKKMVAKAAFGGSLHTICSGGAYLDPDYVDRFQEYGITVLQGYGMTECSPVISTNLEWNCKKESVGKLLPNCEARVVDEEIWVRGTSVMMGYYKMPEETAEALEDGWLKTCLLYTSGSMEMGAGTGSGRSRGRIWHCPLFF